MKVLQLNQTPKTLPRITRILGRMAPIVLVALAALGTGCVPPLFTILTPAPISEAFEIEPGRNQITASQGLVLAVECSDSYQPCRNLSVSSSEPDIAAVQPAFLGTVAYVDNVTGETVPSYQYTGGADTNIGEQQKRTGFLITSYNPGRAVLDIEVNDTPYAFEVFVQQDVNE